MENHTSTLRKVVSTLVLQLLSPPVVMLVVSYYCNSNIVESMEEAAFGWRVNGLWTQVVAWCVWWPAWLAGGVLVSS